MCVPHAYLAHLPLLTCTPARHVLLTCSPHRCSLPSHAWLHFFFLHELSCTSHAPDHIVSIHTCLKPAQTLKLPPLIHNHLGGTSLLIPWQCNDGAHSWKRCNASQSTMHGHSTQRHHPPNPPSLPRSLPNCDPTPPLACAAHADFGLAVFFDPDKLPRGDLGLEGTPWYMAPEMLSCQVEPASDVWSAGVMAYQLLSGRFPFDDWKNSRSPALSLIWCVVPAMS